MEPHAPYSVNFDPFDNKYVVCALHITIDRIPVYMPLRSLRYDQMTDAIRGAQEHQKRSADHTARLIGMTQKAMEGTC